MKAVSPFQKTVQCHHNETMRHHISVPHLKRGLTSNSLVSPIIVSTVSKLSWVLQVSFVLAAKCCQYFKSFGEHLTKHCKYLPQMTLNRRLIWSCNNKHFAILDC